MKNLLQNLFKKKEKQEKSTEIKPKKGSFLANISKKITSKLGKTSAEGEEIVGVEITNKEIRLAQVSSNKANQWILENFFIVFC